MAYQSRYTGKEVEHILDEALLREKQVLTDSEKKQVRENLGIKDPDLSDYATKDDLEDAIGKIPIPDVSGQIDTALKDYVRKEPGKGLSTNDFTDELKQKLDGIKNEKDDILLLEISEVGEVAVTYGESSGFATGEIRETGELVLEFNIE